ncbi:MAG: SDR family oxidoreductase [Tepidisphaeraceae bacterium]|jgi:short-subunit dehydrogenase
MAKRSGKTALVTGASVGIGRDLADLFASDGHDLVLVSRNRAQLEDLAIKLRRAHGVEVQVMAKDLSMPGAGQEIFDQVESAGISVEYLVNNAGFGANTRFADSDVMNQLGMVQVNIGALTHLTRLFLPGMLKRRSGRIMNLGSVAGFMPGPYMAVYYATKAYVLSFSEALATELRGTGVTITVVCPGPTATEFGARAGFGTGKLALPSMSSKRVAEIAYAATMRGRRAVVTGWGNKILAIIPRLVPRSFAAFVTGRVNRTH